MFIKKIHFVVLQNEEHAGFHTYVADYVEEATPAILKIEPQAADYKLKLGIEKAVLDIIRKNTFTNRVNQADEARDNPIRGFFKVVKGMLHHFNPAMAQAAYNVDLINENFSDITRLSKGKQSMAEEKYIAALNAAQADIALLGLTDWVTEIVNTNNVYLELVKSKNTETDEKPEGNMKLARIDTDTSYNAIADRINAFITIEGDAVFAAFVTKVNNRIDEYNAAIAQRKGRAGKKDDTTETK